MSQIASPPDCPLGPPAAAAPSVLSALPSSAASVMLPVPTPIKLLRRIAVLSQAIRLIVRMQELVQLPEQDVIRPLSRTFAVEQRAVLYPLAVLSMIE